MHLFAKFVALSSALTWTAQAFASPDPDGPDTEVAFGRGFILEYSSDSHAASKRDSLLSQNGVRVVKSFDSSIFSGAQVEATDLDLDEIAAMPGVLRAWVDSKVDLLRLDKREVPVSPDDAFKHAVHWATDVHKLHERGIFGKGVKIGVVDTGILYDHSALGGGIGPGYKVAGGYDLVGDAWTIGSEPKPDSDPKDQQGHGTHVAGIIAGHSAETGWKGVAPDASLYAYKAFALGGSTTQSVLIDAFLRAYEDGMDIITASVGGAGGYADNPWALVATRLANEGVVVTIAAGNSGQGGPFFASTGSAGSLSLSVASVSVVGNHTILPSTYTSWGGLYDLSVKPDIAAPGQDVFSTWIGEDNNQFALVSGTSMATPYIAGVAALYISQHGGRQVHGSRLARDLNMRIISSGTSVQWRTGTGSPGPIPEFIAPTHQVGTGIVNALKVLDSSISADLQKFALNDTRRTRRHQSVTLYNHGETRLSFDFEVEASAGFEMLMEQEGVNSNAEFPRIRYSAEMAPIKAVAAVKVPEKFELAPGQSGVARFVFDAPKGLNETTLPAYGGKIVIKGSNGDRLAVPFQGLGFDLREQLKGSMFSGTYPWLRAHMPPVPKTVFTLNESLESQDYPKIFSKIKWGSREIRWDIYDGGFAERHWRYPPVVGDNGYLGSATTWAGAQSVSQFNPARHNSSDTLPFPFKDLPRNAMVSGSFTSVHYWFGKLANGTYLPSGTYTMRYATLLPFSDPAQSDSWDGITTEFIFDLPSK